tara:strand:+ start:3021 stop:4265 length:1245 start_codon:yes stop_codon:yes gene_type:complete
VKIRVLFFLWFLKLFLSILYHKELVVFFIIFDLIIFFSSRIFKNTFFFNLSYLLFQILSILLYLSYEIESSSIFSYGGDDSLIYDYINNYNPKNIPITNYPLFLYINYYIKDLSFFIFGNLEFKFLLYFNNIIASLTLYNYYLISEKYNFKNFYVLFLFTPFFYFSSLYLRDVYIYFLISIYFLIIVSNYNSYLKFILKLIIVGGVFFLRPESSLIIPLYEIFRYLYSKIYAFKFRALFFLVLCIIFINITFIVDVIASYLLFGFRDINLMKEIYFSSESIGTLGRLLIDKSSIAYYIFNILRPIPPYFFSIPTFENFIQIPGNFIWYLTVILSILNFKKIILSNPNVLSIISVFLLYVALVSFVGGTARHFYALIPFLVLNLYNISNLFNSRFNNIIIMISISFILLFYLIMV